MNEAASRALFDAEAEVITRLAQLRNWKLYAYEYPIAEVGFQQEGRKELRLRLSATNWNDDPAGVALLKADGTPLTGPEIPKHPGGVYNAGPHTHSGRPFVCMAGTREYHTHQSHVGDSWNNYKGRERFTLAGLLTQLWSAWLKCPV